MSLIIIQIGYRSVIEQFAQFILKVNILLCRNLYFLVAMISDWRQLNSVLP